MSTAWWYGPETPGGAQLQAGGGTTTPQAVSVIATLTVALTTLKAVSQAIAVSVRFVRRRLMP